MVIEDVGLGDVEYREVDQACCAGEAASSSVHQ